MSANPAIWRCHSKKLGVCWRDIQQEVSLSSRHVTTTALLESLKDPAKGAAWTELDTRFRPLVTAFAARLGLDSSEAEDVAQETLVEFVRAFGDGNYDRSRGRLSSWIFSIARHRIAHRRRSIGRAADRRGDSALIDLSDPDRLAALWEEEQRRRIVLRAVEVLRFGKEDNPALRAFELVALRGVPAEEAARECGLTVDEVYTAKNRVGKRLRRIVEELTASWQEQE